MAYTFAVGVTQIVLFAIGLPLVVFIFLYRHRHELKKPVVRFRYGLFFAGFRTEKFYWECIVALRKESTVLLAVFGPQMGVEMLAHVALLVFMVQILVQLVGHPYETRQIKLQILDVTSIVVCWGTMWSGFFFYSPRPPSQKKALVFLTILVVVVNSIYMAVLLYSMCSETCKEHESNVIVKSFRRRTSGVRHGLEKRSSRRNLVKRSRTQHVQNPTIQALKEIELTKIKKVSARSLPETVPLSRVQSKRRSTMSKNKKKEDPKKPQREKSATQQMRKERLKSLHTKRRSEVDGKLLFYTNPSRVKMNPLSVGGSGGGEEKGTAGRRQSFRLVEDVEGDYFENVETGNTVWDLPEDGDLVEMEHVAI